LGFSFFYEKFSHTGGHDLNFYRGGEKMSIAIQRLTSISLGQNVSKIMFVLQWILLLSWIPLTLYGLFFTPIMSLHDAVHPARHSVTIVPCH
jgi:hypothetical protein